MKPPKIEIRHGRFHDLTGPPQYFHEITFAAAEVELEGTMFQLSHFLEDHLDRIGVSPENRSLIRPGEEAVWVRGRAQQLFKIPGSTEEDRTEKTFFAGRFLALFSEAEGQYLGTPFECRDCYARSGLMFSSEDPPPEELTGRLAEAFWGLLLSDPANLEDYRDSLFHTGAGVWLDFGIEDGEPFLEERSG